MICERCLEKETTVHITKEAEGVTQTLALCPDCASELGFHSPLDEAPFPLASLLNRLFSDPSALTPEDQDADFHDAIPDLTCPNCKLTYKEFVKSGRFGCGECYREFRTRVEHIMLKIHGAAKHVGATPLIEYDQMHSVQREEQLKEQLAEAINSEQYELAAQLRDQLNKLHDEELAAEH